MKITLIEAIRNVERPAPSPENRYAFDVCIEEMMEELGLQTMYTMPDELDLRLREYPLAKWICTDTHVGLTAVYLDDEPMGSAWQPYRKSSKEYRWLSQECADRVRDVILSYVKPEERRNTIIDPNEEIEETYSVDYAEQLLIDEGFFMGKPVRVLVRYTDDRETAPAYRREGHSYFEKVAHNSLKNECLLVTDGKEEFCIEVRQFKIPLRMKRVDE